MTLAHAARTWVRARLGVDVQRYPQSDPLFGVTTLLRHLEVDLVVDVGANDGGYAGALRRLGYPGQIVSFEPLPEPFARLSARASRDPGWDVEPCAIGADDGEILIHVAGNEGASSSVLPMLEAHLAAAPAAAYVDEVTVPIHRLDTLLPVRVSLPGRRTFLKMDVQGYERAVLDGAAGLFSAGQVLGVQVEMSLLPLYEGSMLWRETVDRLAGEGFELCQLLPGFTDPATGRLLQADGVFVHEGALPGEH